MSKEKLWNLWEQNWDNAYKFFNSKGNVKTRAKLKKIWYDSFFKGLAEQQKEIDGLKVIIEVKDICINDLKSKLKRKK